MASAATVSEFPLEEEYKKKTGITPQDISKLREWLDTQPHLPGDFISDLELILTYHCCERSSEVSKQVLDLNLTLKTLFTNFYKDRYVNEKLLKAANVVLPLGIKTRTTEGYAIFYGCLVDTDVKNFVFSEVMRTVLMMIDLWQFEEGTWPGLVILIDLDGVSLSHLARLDIQTLQQFLYYLQEAMLVKLKSLHFLNAPSFMDKLMMLIKPFMKKALLDILQIHQIGSRTLDKFVPRECLPKEAGGDYKTKEQCRDDVKARLKANAEFFAAENKERVVEAKRPGRPKTISDIFGGVEGSFKKLDID